MSLLAGIELPSSLRPHTQAFIEANAASLNAIIEPMMNRITKEVTSFKGEDGLVVRKHFHESSENWQRFFWARAGHYLVKEKEALSEALLHADEDLLTLDQLNRPL